jgi:hypothetical protein
MGGHAPNLTTGVEMDFLRIVLLTTALAMAYGVAHDMVTAHLCVEYFTVAHPDIFGTETPALLALGWGVWATWWVGAPLGLLLALAARSGARPKLAVRDLLLPGALLLASMALASLAAGVAGYVAASAGRVELSGAVADAVPVESHGRFIADMYAHRAAYLAGFFGGVGLAVWAWLRRARLSERTPRPTPAPSPSPPAPA